MNRSLTTATAATASAAVLGLSGCGGSNSTNSSGSNAAGSSSATASSSKTITVLAAASLTESFTKLAQDFEKNHPGVEIKMSFAGSQDIARQLKGGAPADVVAMADTTTPKTMPADITQGKTWTDFATNELEIATPKGNPGDVTDLASLAKVNTVLCAKTVPCGRAADKALTKANVHAHVVSYEQNVKSTLAKVSSGDADAAVVYRTDVKAAGDKVTGVDIASGSNVKTTLPIATWSNNEYAKQFVQLITGAEGRKVLSDAGFGSPS